MAKKIRVLFVTSEAHPLIKTGGLADVSEALPRALNGIGVDARLLIPGYPSVLDGHALRHASRQPIPFQAYDSMTFLQGKMPDGVTPLYVLRCDELYDRAGGPYQDPSGTDWADNAQRFGALSYVAALIGSQRNPLRWSPDIVHCNDWQGGLAPAYLAHDRARRARTVMSVHNIVFPGAFPPETTQALGLPWEAFAMHGLEFYGRMAFLKAGLFYADHITTVSPSYAEEIKTEAYGGGLHGLLQSRAHELTGILNGIDTELWDPGTDSHLAAHYSRSNLEAKAGNKRALRSRLGLADQSHRPLLGMVSRLTAQKGADLIPEALAALDGRAFQLAILGSGDRAIEATLRDLAAKQPATIIFISSYDEGLAHQIEAGADVFLMPSRFEPCGLNQMYSMRYGTPPLVRRTGGLADTVVDVSEETLGDGTATGFVFESPEAQAVGACIRRAVDLYQDEAAWRALQENGMRKDFSWTRSARRYKDVYKAVLARFGYHSALHPPARPKASLRS